MQQPKPETDTRSQVIPTAYVVILNWNGKEDTVQCVRSILAQRGCDVKIIIVDNGSTDDSVSAFEEEWGHKVTIIDHPTNVGFAAGMNLGIRHALDMDAEWILVLNNDTVAEVDMLAQLMESAQNHPQIGILSPAIYYYDDPDRIWRIGDRQHDYLPIPLQVPKSAVESAETLTVDYVPGCAMLIRRAVLEHIGLFNERLFMYFEDADLCRRAVDSGYAVVCSCKARLWHKVSQSTKRQPVTMHYHQMKGRVIFLRKYPHGPWRRLTDIYLILTLVGRLLSRILSGEIRSARAIWLGFQNGWKESRGIAAN